MKQNMSRQQIYWRIGTGIAALWWASRPKRRGLPRTIAGMVGTMALFEGVTGYSPIMEALGMESMAPGAGTRTPAEMGVRSGMPAGTAAEAVAAQYLTESTLEDMGTDSHAAGGEREPGRILLRIGDYAVQKLPRQRDRSDWDAEREHNGVDYPTSVTPDSVGWSWDELVDNE